MRENCFLFTSCFPFNYGETFLENEIEFLSKAFDNVFIFATTSDTSTIRKTPDNVKYFSLNLTCFPFKRIKKIIYGLFFFDLKFKRKKIRDVVECLYKRGTVSLAIKKIIRILGKDYDKVSNSIFYSYWLNETALISGILRKKYFSSFNVRCLSRGHGSDVFDYSQKVGFNAFKEQAISMMDRVFFISEAGKGYNEKLFPEFASKFFVSRLGTFLHEHNKLTKNEVIRFVTCSNIIPIKRVELFAEAFVNLSKCYDKIFWDCFGDGQNLPYIKKLINNSGLNDKVTFHGRKTNKEIIDFYKTNYVDWFVNVSISEGIPVSIMEAYSFGIPAIATNVGGTSELVNNDNGFLIDKNITSKDLTSILLNACKLRIEILKSKKESCFQIWNERYNAAKNYPLFISEAKNI